MKHILISFVIFLSVFFAKAEILLPESQFISGWIRSDTLREFTSANLYGHINGGAEIFFELGFNKLTVQKYFNNTREIILEIYEMESAESALGIYLQKAGKESPNKMLSGRNTCNSYQYTLVKGNYFIQINNFSGVDNKIPLDRMANIVLNQIPEQSVSLFEILPKEGLKTNSERIIRGPLTLQSIYTFGNRDILNLKGKIFGVVADYEIESGQRFTKIMITYPDSQKAQQAFLYLQTNLDPYLKLLNKDNQTLVFGDFRQKYGSATRFENVLILKVHLNNPPEYIENQTD